MTQTSSTEMEEVYDYVRARKRKKEMKDNIQKDNIELIDTLGTGNFGSVFRGKYKYRTKMRKTKEVPVAVKVLKDNDSPTAEV